MTSAATAFRPGSQCPLGADAQGRNRPVAAADARPQRYRYGLTSGEMAAADFRRASKRIREMTNAAKKAVPVTLAHKNPN